jgi:hypothetical protein
MPIHNSISINAPAKEVFAIIIDLPTYHNVCDHGIPYLLCEAASGVIKLEREKLLLQTSIHSWNMSQEHGST